MEEPPGDASVSQGAEGFAYAIHADVPGAPVHTATTLRS
jgi:hypothetical protein